MPSGEEGAMAIKVRCPHCDARLTVPEERRGQTGRCPTCRGLVPIEADAEVPALAAAQQPAAPFERGPDAGPASGLTTGLGASGADPYGLRGGEGPLVVPAPGEDVAYDLEVVGAAPAAEAAPAVLPRAGAMEPPKKSKKARARELEDLRAEGNRFLLKIRLLLLGLGLLMVAFNVYSYTTIEENISAFKQAVTSNPRVVVDRAKLEEVATNLRTALRVECGMYFLLGLVLCGLAVVIHKAPLLATWAALGTYVGAAVVDIMLIQALFGEIAAGQALFSFGTLVKLGIIGGLWHGVQVGQAYEEQVIRPQRELIAEEDGP
jgi:hypothetical protein